MRPLLAAMAAVIICGALGLSLTGGSGRVGKPAPPLPTRMLSGPPTVLTRLRGEPVVVDSFASWCEPCTAEAPTLQRTAQALRGHAHLVAVDWSDSRRYALSFLRRFHWTFPVLFDPQGTAGYAYGIEGLPSAFVVDADGRIVRRLVGSQTLASLHQAVTAARAGN